VADTFAYEVASGADGLIVRLSGHIDMATVGPIQDYLLALDDLIVTLDFCDVAFMDTTGVNLLVQLQRRLRDDNGKLVLYGVQPTQLRVLEVLGLIDHFDCLVPD
jgi:anti-sigma B factor antagonist